MDVPITSDLQGYTAFWRNQVYRLVMIAAGGWAVIVALLGGDRLERMERVVDETCPDAGARDGDPRGATD